MFEFKLIRSLSNNPAVNLALEEYLIEQKDPVIYLWQNEPTIVIGRNQNPYKECDLKKIKEDRVHLMRRRSGGGAVYHDYGNLNFTIISKKYPEVVEDNFNLVIKVLNNFGIHASISGRNDLEIDGKKISGSAFYEEDDVHCHHGTLLINVDTSKMQQYLTASKLKLESKGVDSVKSRVTNLINYKNDLTIDDIVDGFSKVTEEKVIDYSEDEIKSNPKIIEKINKYNSWEWKFGESIKYNVEFNKKFSWGIVNIELFVENGIIKNSKIYTDSIIIDNFEDLAKSLIGLKFDKFNLINETKKIINNSNIIHDLENLFDID